MSFRDQSMLESRQAEMQEGQPHPTSQETRSKKEEQTSSKGKSGAQPEKAVALREWIVEVFNNPADYNWEKSCTIYRVPNNLKDIHKDSFTPKIISIGPFHYHSVRGLDDNKKRYLFRLLKLMSVNEGHRNPSYVYDKLLEEMMASVKETKRCYSQPAGEIEFDSTNNTTDPELIEDSEFAEMMLLDGCFVIELLRLFHLSKEEPVNDPIFTTPWMLPTLQRDLLKLENQLPFFVLERLFELTRVVDERQLPLVHLVILFFNPLFPRENPISRLRHKVRYDHMLDVFRFTFLSSVFDNMVSESNLSDQVKLLHYSTTGLKEVGIMFKPRKDNDLDLLDIDFKDGYLEIPPLPIHDGSVPLFLNVLAYEQCHDKAKPFFSNFFLFLDSLVNFQLDVEILRKNGILVHALGSDEQVATLFNKLGREIVCSSDMCYLSKQIKQVNQRCHNYYASYWLKFWRDTIKTYFSSPWSALSLAAAIVLLALTITQTFYTIYPYYHLRK